MLIKSTNSYTCSECDTDFPVIEVCKNGKPENHIMCNGFKITECPWCRKDSKAWTNGRGI